MAYQLEKINQAVRADKLGFMEECDHQYQKKVEQAADLICKNMKLSPVVLLSGPSGSGKTTTAHKITAELQRRLEEAGSEVLSLAAHPGLAATSLLRGRRGRLVEAAESALIGLLGHDDVGGAQPTLMAATCAMMGFSAISPFCMSL